MAHEIEVMFYHAFIIFYIVGPVGNVPTRVTLRLLCDLRHHAAEHNCRADCGLLPNAEAWEILKQHQRDLIVEQGVSSRPESTIWRRHLTALMVATSLGWDQHC